MRYFLNDIRRALSNPSKAIYAMIVGIVFYILFHVFFELLLSNTIVKYLLSPVESTWYNDLIFTGIILASIFFIIEKWEKYIPTRNFAWLLLYGTLLYLFYRVTNKVWVFIPFTFFPKLKYADVCVVITAINITLLLFRKRGKIPSNNANSFFDDISIGNEQVDELGYNTYAKIVSDKIRASHFNKSFAIGINGKWGLGKTSFVDLIKRNIYSSDNIEVEFNPWNSQTPNAIIKDFFDSMQEAIRPYHSKLAILLVRYANKLAAINENSITKSVQSSISILLGADSLNSIFNSINFSLKEINKKIIIYIDDLDRLDKEEIIEVIRLIRNTANFYNTFFIVSYDKNYISNALKAHNAFSHEQFLEKIFQIEITLPYFKNDILRKKLFEKLKFALPEIYHSSIEEAIIGTSVVMRVDIADWLETMRDVTRLSNSISLNGTALFGEVEVSDFIRIELLRLKYPMVYELLFRKKNLFFKPSQSNGIDMRYQLLIAKDQHDEKVEDVDKNEKYLKLYLRKHASELMIRQNEIDKITNYVQSLFNDSNGQFYHASRVLSIVFPSKFDRYFSYTLFDENLSEVEFSNTIKLDSDALKAKINEWMNKGLTYEVQRRFMLIRSFENKQEFEKIIKIIFYLANKLNSEGSYPAIVGYDGKDLVEKLSDYNETTSSKFYQNHGGKEGLRIFIKSVLNTAETPYHFESQFVNYVNSILIDDTMFPLKKEELEEISVTYLKKYSESATEFNINIFSLFWNTEQHNFQSNGGSYLTDKEFPSIAKEIICEFVKKHLDDLILYSIEIEPLHQKTFTVARSISSIFGGWDKFRALIFGEDETKWKYLNEFKGFYNLAQKNNFSNYVAFDFDIIPIASKMRSKK